ncbi:MAG: class I SAM-dependent methyltransferase [Chloroflexi bacterium]|nr:class I SAM-dependent methyltransferase [Chloroflexota bacterium]
MFRRLKFNLSYFGKAPWDSGISPPELFDFIQTHPAGRAIDLGCGTGTNVITLAKAGWQVTGMDFAVRAIQIAKRKTQHAGVTADLHAGDVTKLNLNQQFDLALDIGCFHGVKDRAAYLDQLTRLLVPGGFWLMYGFFNPAPHHAGPGLVAADLDMISARGLTLLSRKDGFDKRERPSAWFLYQKPSS